MENGVTSGQLGEIFFPELIYQIRAQRLTGFLRVTLDAVLKAVFFENGLMVFALSNLKAEQLEQTLLARGVVTERTLKAPGVEQGKRLASSLIATGLLSRDEITSYVHEQVLGIIYSLFDWENGSFTFDEKTRANHEIKLVTPPGDIILEGVRRINNPNFFHRALSLGEAQLLPAATAQSGNQSLNLRPAEAYVLSRVEQPTRVKDLISLVGLPELETLRAAYGLVAAGMLTLSRPEKARPVQKQVDNSQAPAAPESPEEELARLRAEVLRASAVAHAEDHYEVLGLTRGADLSEIKRAYYSLAKKFHPDRAHTLNDPQMRERMEKVFQKVSEAYETLADPTRRAMYDEKLGEQKSGPAAAAVKDLPHRSPLTQPSSTKEEAPKVSPAAVAPSPPASQPGPSRVSDRPPSPVTPPPTEPKSAQASPQQAEQIAKFAAAALAKGDLMTAVEMLRRAVEAAPDDGSLRLQLADLLARNRRWYPEAESHYLQLVQRAPQADNYQMALGNFYKNAGESAKAEAAFRRALQINPSHRDAMRQLKGLRGEKGKPQKGAQPDGGVFSRFFKR